MTVPQAPQPYWKPKETKSGMWPVWVIIGLFVVVVFYLMSTKSSPDISKAEIGIADPEDAKPKPPPGPPAKPKAGRPLDAYSLEVGWSVLISAPAPMVPEVGIDVKGPQAKPIPAGSIIKILAKQIQTQGRQNTKWYNVEATDAKGAAVGTGWVRSMNLEGEGQTLKSAD